MGRLTKFGSGHEAGTVVMMTLATSANSSVGQLTMMSSRAMKLVKSTILTLAT